MRPPALEKMGYYQTSLTVAQLLKTYFKPADSGRLLDPCAGEGTAASILANALNCQSWGAELSPARAALAAEKMDRLFNTPWGSCHLMDFFMRWNFELHPFCRQQDDLVESGFGVAIDADVLVITSQM